MVTVQLVPITLPLMPLLSNASAGLVSWSIPKVFAYRSATTMRYTIKGLPLAIAFKIWPESEVSVHCVLVTLISVMVNAYLVRQMHIWSIIAAFACLDLRLMHSEFAEVALPFPTRSSWTVSASNAKAIRSTIPLWGHVSVQWARLGVEICVFQRATTMNWWTRVATASLAAWTKSFLTVPVSAKVVLLEIPVDFAQSIALLARFSSWEPVQSVLSAWTICRLLLAVSVPMDSTWIQSLTSAQGVPLWCQIAQPELFMMQMHRGASLVLPHALPAAIWITAPLARGDTL